MVNGKCQLRLHQNSETKMRRRLKSITSRSNGMGYANRKEALKEYLRGWTEYYNLAVTTRHQPCRKVEKPPYADGTYGGVRGQVNTKRGKHLRLVFTSCFLTNTS